MQKAELNQ